ncbi:MAG: ATP-binding cassette domain-containing protein [Ruminiclostridium sp.]
MEKPILKVRGLSKSYKHKEAMSRINMSINKGDIYGFVGKNGAGKTTLIRIISGLTSPHEGSFELFGIKRDSRKIDGVRKSMPRKDNIIRII